MSFLAILLEYARYLVLSFYRWIIKLKINAHQLIAHWKSKANQPDNLLNRQNTVSLTDVNVARANNRNEDFDRVVGGTTAPIKIESHNQRHTTIYQSTSLDSGHQSRGLKYIKTPRFRRSRLFSLLRRLSPRNFMDYCVIALNEASGSTSSVRFDLSTCNSSIWLLGQEYRMPDESDQLIDDIRSKLWITYRKNFPPIDENTRYTSDRGFGCMIRCGQMVLANALLHKNLGRTWRWSPKGLEANPTVYNKILRMFQDREDCPYSIHQIVQTGLHEGKSVGEWFGPNTIAQALKRLSSNHLSPESKIDCEVLISIDAALDNMVVIDEIKSKFKSSEGSKNGTSSGGATKLVDGDKIDKLDTDGGITSRSSGGWTPGILFIQLRLGLTKINPLYFAALKKTFQFQNSLGIIGGRPNHALYLVGYTDDDIIYLDPHSTQQYIDFDELSKQTDEQQQRQQDSGEAEQEKESEVYTEADQSPEQEQSADYLSPDSTYHCSCPEKMSLERLDPSLALCFYFDTEQEFDKWCNLSDELLVKSEQAPMFEITKSRPTDWNVSLTTRTISKSSSDQDEEFEILS